MNGYFSCICIGEIAMGLLDNLRRKKEDIAGADEQERWQIGDIIENRYEIHDIKRGGFGIVYICYDHEYKMPLAIKTFQARFLHSQKARDDFTRESLTWIKLDKHKNIVKAIYVENIEYQPYIFLEYIAGGNLDDWLYTKMLDLPLAMNFAVQFCNGMEYAYEKMQLIHRDIKPGNILLTSDKTLKITDFGLAKARETTPEMTEVPNDISYIQSGPAGTLLYMAPEQFTGKEIDTRADIYAFGIVLYQMVAGSYPYPRKSPWKEMHLKESPLSIKQNIPRELNAVIQKCLEKEPGRRYQNFRDLKVKLSKIYFDLTGERIIEEPTEEIEIWELNDKGIALDNLGRYQEALTCHDKALEINPRFAESWNNKGNALRNLVKYQEALACYNKALEINPRYAGAWYNKGNVMHDLGKYQEALACYNKALEINPRYAGAWNNKGNTLDELGMHQEALACYDKALDINPRHAEAWNSKGNALQNLGRHQEALACYDKALEINPRDDEAWYNKGNALGKREALACYDKALEINPRHVKAWYNKGNELSNLGMHQEAVMCYDKTLEINPRHVKAWYNKGNALLKLGMHQEAVICFDKVLEINPRDDEAWANKGVALVILGIHEDAVACFDKALEINPRYSEALINKGNVLSNLGRNQEALLSYKNFIKFAPPKYAVYIEGVKETIRQLEEIV
ncbi:MAG: tetratricopeptide repeat protein [Candidatus Methanoperedens sp.]|nr:tetratricopeptide repeat protein [Candidatus Methanoperedens sp.]